MYCNIHTYIINAFAAGLIIVTTNPILIFLTCITADTVHLNRELKLLFKSRFSTADWNIMNQRKLKGGLQITLKNYCESWRMNVELHNIRGIDVVPEECVEFIGKYMSSAQYKV